MGAVRVLQQLSIIDLKRCLEPTQKTNVKPWFKYLGPKLVSLKKAC